MFPHLLGRRGPGRYVAVGGGTGETDPGFEEQPVVTVTASGDTTINGKVKAGSFGKFVLPLASIAAGHQYTFRYTPSFNRLAQQGKLAMVGFGLKNGNDFHIVGLRGDGTTGLNKYKVLGTPPNGWNKDTGHTTSDGGAAANGTRAGPNYIRLSVSSDGAAYAFSTSADGVLWATEYTGTVPTPFSNVSGVATFGIALWFNNADAGPFSIVIDQFADVVLTWTNIAQGTGSGNSSGWDGYTLRTVIGKANFAWIGGDSMRITLEASTVSGFTIDGCYIEHGATSGDVYDYAQTPTQVFFDGGSAGLTIGAGQTKVSDIIGFKLQPDKNLVVGVHFSAGSAIRVLTGVTVNSYYRAATSEAATVDATTGYTNTGHALVNAVEILIDKSGGISPTDKDSSLTITGNRVVLKSGAAFGLVRSQRSHSSGKYYLEAVYNNVVTPHPPLTGLCLSSLGLIGHYPGDDLNGIGWAASGDYFINAANTSFFGNMADLDRVGHAYDLDNNKAWWRVNGGVWNAGGTADPVTGIGGVSFPAGLVGTRYFAVALLAASELVTVNVGETAFTDTRPTGFSGWG